MVYLKADERFLYHVDCVTKRGKHYTRYYEIYEGQLLTLCEAIQKFDLTVMDIIYKYPLAIIRISRRLTVRTEYGRYIKSEDDIFERLY